MPLMAPSTVVMPREGSFALASFGRIRKVQALAFSDAAGWRSFAVKRILEAVLFTFAWLAMCFTRMLLGNWAATFVHQRRLAALSRNSNPLSAGLENGPPLPTSLTTRPSSQASGEAS